jgi:hypothetical protein
MSLSYSNRTVAGEVSGEILSGYEPLPWLMVPIEVGVMVWDRQGLRCGLSMTERVVIQGKENVGIYRHKIYQGCEVLAMGQSVPVYAVANDSGMRGSAMLASIFQIPEKHQKET